ncbi:ribosome maturation factor RimP [Pseudofrankia sp. DC12]|uniref:ribosome maturation factor RimP n=1 Tax=Pseudofrankia sp. DC12 TaxID=683315 RepID=UPI0009FBBBC0|nr:ribosome maturation factor RimP [Pseudofrankia sp. DC12]
MARDASGRTGHRPQAGGSARPGGAATGAGPAGKKAQPGRSVPSGHLDEPGTAQRARAGSGAKATAGSLPAEIRDRLAEALAEDGFDLDGLSLSRAGSRSVLRVAVDRDEGIDLDAVADASRLISELLDRIGDEGGLAGAYVLEVTSPGVDRPLTQPQHWRRARGRLVEAQRADGAVVVGRVLGADDEGADLAVAAGPVRRGRPVKTKLERLRFADVARAVVQIEFGPAGGDAVAAAGVDAGRVDPAGDELDDGWADDGWADDLDELDVGDDQHGDDDPGDARRAPTAGRREDGGGSPGEETDR